MKSIGLNNALYMSTWF